MNAAVATQPFPVTPITLALPGRSARRAAMAMASAAGAWVDVRPVLVPWIGSRVAVAVVLLAASILGSLPGLAVPAAWPAAPRWMDAFLRYDAANYLSIASVGYEPWSIVFFPAYPMAIRLFAPLLSAPLAAVVLSHAAFLVALALCHRLVREELGGATATRTVWALCLWPTTVFFSAGYTESLFLALACGALLAARRGRGMAAGLLAGVACLTRITGAALFLAVVVEVLIVRRGSLRARIVSLLPGVAVALAFPAWQALRYGNPLLFVTSQSHWSRSFSWPLAAILGEVRFALADPHGIRWLVYVPTFVAIAAFAVLAVRVRSMPSSLWLYAMTALLMAIVNPVHGGARHPLVSLDRYVLVAFPALLALVELLPGARSRRAAAIASGAGAAVLSLLFGLGAFIE